VHDLVREADQHAARAGRRVVGTADVRAAIQDQERRAGRLRERVEEEIRRGTLVVETDGARIGQVNGLSVSDVGMGPFGRPVRITARVRLGRGEVIDIEREVALGGPIHSKGVLILGGYLGARYCAQRPLTLAATLVFEQSYAGVEGDSASCAELYALVSAIAEVPLAQGLAVTGAVDQLGRVQAVGGLNEKIEGFFRICSARGLTGAQGVLVPTSNVSHLVLREDVLGAIREERFRIYPVETVDEGLELLTGLPHGVPDAAGRYADGTLGARVVARLDAFAQRAKEFAIPPRDEPRRP
jgi:predicted ATP-dependent protease